MTIDELIEEADEALNSKINEPIERALNSIATSQIAIAKLMNRKVCTSCGGQGYSINKWTKMRNHCPTCKGRGRVE